MSMPQFLNATRQLVELGHYHSTAQALARPALSAPDEPGSLLIYTLNKRGDQQAEFVSDKYDLAAARWAGRHAIEIPLA